MLGLEALALVAVVVEGREALRAANACATAIIYAGVSRLVRDAFAHAGQLNTPHSACTNTGADYFGLWPFISTKLTFVPNQPNRRIPCAKPVLFHNFFFENSKKIVNPKKSLG